MLHKEGNLSLCLFNLSLLYENKFLAMNYYCYMCTQGWLIAHPEYALICGLQWMVVVKTILNLTFCFVSFLFLVVHTNCACLCYSISFQVTQGRFDRNLVSSSSGFTQMSVSEISMDNQHWQQNLLVKIFESWASWTSILDPGFTRRGP